MHFNLYFDRFPLKEKKIAELPEKETTVKLNLWLFWRWRNEPKYQLTELSDKWTAITESFQNGTLAIDHQPSFRFERETISREKWEF